MSETAAHRFTWGTALSRGLAALLLLAALGPVARAQSALPVVKVAALRVSGIAPLLIAQERGYFKAQGIDEQNVLVDNFQDTILAVASGATQITAGAMAAGVYNVAAKGAVKIIAGGLAERPGLHNIGVAVTNAAWDSGVRSIKDLAGKRVGISGLGGPAHYAFALMAKKYGLSISDFTLVQLGALPTQIAAFKGGQVDALIAGNPIPKQFEHDHSGHILAWSGDEAPWQLGAVFANADTIAHQPELIRKFLRAFSQGCQDYVAAFNQLDAAGKPVKGANYDAYLKLVADNFHMPPAAFEGTFGYFDPSLKIDDADLTAQIKFWQSQGSLPATVTEDGVVDRSFEDFAKK